MQQGDRRREIYRSGQFCVRAAFPIPGILSTGACVYHHRMAPGGGRSDWNGVVEDGFADVQCVVPMFLLVDERASWEEVLVE